MKEIILSNGDISIVDKSDYIKFSKMKWHVIKRKKQKHAYGKKNGKTIYLHREILNAKKGQIVDHINRNGLDNRKCNLRFANKAINANNTKYHENSAIKLKGVTVRKDRNKKYRATIVFEGKQIYLGSYYTPEEAATSYDIAAVKYYGKNTYLNNIG